jgi:DeoR/GlpR family transcriptional regulator of sugar metabolism
LSAIDVLITDNGIDPKTAEEIRAAGVEIVLV